MENKCVITYFYSLTTIKNIYRGETNPVLTENSKIHWSAAWEEKYDYLRMLFHFTERKGIWSNSSLP